MRTLPKNSSCLNLADYLPYLGAPLAGSRNPSADLNAIWRPLLPDRHLVPTPTGRHALWLFLQRSGLQPGDEVLVSAYNFYVVVRLLIQFGLKPVFVDTDPQTLAMDLQDLRAQIGPRSRLLLLTHLFGIPAPVSEIAAICSQHKLLLFEDAAHAVGSRDPRGQQLGQAGQAALFSFGVEKMINCFGGGMLALAPHFADPLPMPPHPVQTFWDHASRALITALMSPGIYTLILGPGEKMADKLAHWGFPGFARLLDPSRDDPNYRFEVASRAPFKPFMLKMMRRQLARLDANINSRLRHVHQVKLALAQAEGVRFLDENRHGSWNGSYFGMYVADPKSYARTLQSQGIGANALEFLNCAGLAQFADFGGDCPGAQYIEDHLLRLPSYPGITTAQSLRMATALAHCAVAAAPPAAVKNTAPGEHL